MLVFMCSYLFELFVDIFASNSMGKWPCNSKVPYICYIKSEMLLCLLLSFVFSQDGTTEFSWRKFQCCSVGWRVQLSTPRLLRDTGRGSMKKPGQFHPGSRLRENPDWIFFPEYGMGENPAGFFSRSTEWGKSRTEYDGASDLSDSERIPIPPSPCTPPELILRAEEIDPVYL